MLLDRLPDELKLEVLYQLYSDRVSDLARVALCCRSFYELATPILYSSFACCGQSKSKTSDFVSTIVARPDLARYVQQCTAFHPFDHTFGPTNINITDAQMRTALEKACGNDAVRDEWLALCYFRTPESGIYGCGNCDAITSFLMLHLPNLSILHIPYYYWEPPSSRDGQVYFLHFILDRASKLQNSGILSDYSLSKLRDVTISMEIESEFPLPLIRLESIRRVTLLKSTTPIELLDDGAAPFYVEPINHLTHLFFPDGNVHSPALAKLLACCNSLLNFSYVHCTLGKEDLFIPPVIRDGLVHAQDSLQELTLINDQEEDLQDRAFDSDGLPTEESENRTVLPFGSLANFRRLRRLDITISALLGRSKTDASLRDPLIVGQDERHRSQAKRTLILVESLPDSLETLQLRLCDAGIYAVVNALFERKRQGSLRRLREVTLFFQMGYPFLQVLAMEERVRYKNEEEELGIRVLSRSAQRYYQRF